VECARFAAPQCPECGVERRSLQFLGRCQVFPEVIPDSLSKITNQIFNILIFIFLLTENRKLKTENGIIGLGAEGRKGPEANRLGFAT
jgi:hypothetical protein